MKGLNKVMLIGRLGRDPELRYTQNGQTVAKFSVATDEVWVDKSGTKQSRVEWHNIVAWGKLAEICNQYLKKGRLVYVEGRIQTRQWEDQSGGKRSTTEIVISDMNILESRTAAAAEPAAAEYGDSTVSRDEPPVVDEPITDDDVPF
ncbi:MAG TPA: single-stranded DNA-binding protein [Acidobacteriota bacterium]|nr:single-stranded DNA-binding protein [Acidobacteriota bacterium]HOT00339.1 single-stranded DNA-binding protein [Acidobacteriota bacterium]HQF87135.1 single-stranded DNA-binding protein [Acidobacteriota bacterium]HQG91696.1 single-stranded DNA-binding protein [Acidobacteriota bacterium]HQK87590.1 single-stranded DNA-binding protein [Acidobacteriota bacterium]